MKREELAIAGVTAIAFGASVAAGESAFLASFHDDAFYYFQIARHAAAGDGLTFDGIHFTNGFHPLWLALLVPIFGVFPGDLAPLRAAALVELALLVLAAIALWRTLRNRIGAVPAFAAALVPAALPGARSALRGGMESALLFLLLILLWNRFGVLEDKDTPAARDFLVPGCLAAAAGLARLEAFSATLVLLWLALRRGIPRGGVALLASIPLGALAALAAWNLARMGSPLPISGEAKAWLASERGVGMRLRGFLDTPWLGQDLVCRAFGVANLSFLDAGGLLVYAAVTGAALLVLWRHRAALRSRAAAARVALPLAACALILVADKAALTELPDWYRVPILLMTALCAGLLVPRAGRASRAVVVLLAVIAAGRGIAYLTLADPADSFAPYRLETARFVSRELPVDARIGSWNAGLLGYFSHRPVINLDGLVNDRTYLQRVIRGKDLAGYLAAERIDWLADQTCRASPTLRPYLRRSGSEEIEAEFALEAAFGNPNDPGGCPGYALWRRFTSPRPSASGG